MSKFFVGEEEEFKNEIPIEELEKVSEDEEFNNRAEQIK